MISPMNMLSALLSIAALSQVVAASPTPPKFGCPTQDDVLQLSPWQSQLYIPPGEKPSAIVLGLGVQNYTCSSETGLYVSAGARAALYDISCQYGSPTFATIVEDAFVQFDDESFNLDSPPTSGLVGSYYFATTESGISPEWDFSCYSGSAAFVIGSEVGVSCWTSLTSPFHIAIC